MEIHTIIVILNFYLIKNCKTNANKKKKKKKKKKCVSDSNLFSYYAKTKPRFSK